MNDYRLRVVNFLAEGDNADAMWDYVHDAMSNGYQKVTNESSLVILSYLKRLVEKGDNRAALLLGNLYYTGLGSIPIDYSKAMELYKQAVDNSKCTDSWTINNLAYCYYYGRAGEVDYEKAYYYFALAALRDNPNAVYKLGDFYYHGNFVEQDYAASFYWYQLAKSYYRCQDDENDDEEYEITARLRESYDEYIRASIAVRLGRAYLYGQGTNIDKNKALAELFFAEKLFSRQASLGDKFSKQELETAKSLINIATNKV